MEIFNFRAKILTFYAECNSVLRMSIYNFRAKLIFFKWNTAYIYILKFFTHIFEYRFESYFLKYGRNLSVEVSRTSLELILKKGFEHLAQETIVLFIRSLGQ